MKCFRCTLTWRTGTSTTPGLLLCVVLHLGRGKKLARIVLISGCNRSRVECIECPDYAHKGTHTQSLTHTPHDYFCYLKLLHFLVA